jgi:Rad3-related DNA helicase
VEEEFSEVGIAPVPEHPKPTALMADAKTGTGKSLAYLVPAALSGSQMVNSTAPKALQHQLVGKDLPAPCRLPMEKRFLTPLCPSLAQHFKVDSKLGAAA